MRSAPLNHSRASPCREAVQCLIVLNSQGCFCFHLSVVCVFLMGAVGQTVMLLIMHTECIIHNRYTIKLIIIIIYKIKWPPCNFYSGKVRSRFLIPLLCYDLTASQMQLVYALCVSVAFVQQRKCFFSNLPLKTCFIVFSYLRSSPTHRLNRNSASGPNTTSHSIPSSGSQVVLLCTYTRIHCISAHKS